MNSNPSLEDVIRDIREDAYEDGTHGAGHPFSVEKDKQAIKDVILTKQWYYYDPDEVGVDAFKRLGDDEVSEL